MFTCVVNKEIDVSFPVDRSELGSLTGIKIISSHQPRMFPCCGPRALDGDGGGEVWILGGSVSVHYQEITL